MLKILLPKSEEVSFRKERTCFCRHEERYSESIELARRKEVEEQRRVRYRDTSVVA